MDIDVDYDIVCKNCLKVLHLSWSWYEYWSGLWYVEFVTIVLKFCIYLDLDMDINVGYDM